MGGTLKVRAWGTRGSLPNPSINCITYGGHTSCFTAETEEHRIIFDAGTGLAALQGILSQEHYSRPLHIFLSHIHMDHIQGLYLFPALFNERAEIHLYGESRDGKSLKEQLETVIGPPYWPVGPENWTADIHWHELDSAMTCCPEAGVLVRTMRANHPNQGLLFRAGIEGKSVVYGLDCEMDSRIWEELTGFASDCDLLISDAFYSPAEYGAYIGRGHSTWEEGLRMALDCRAKRLLCSHHGWDKTDGELYGMERELQSRWDRAAFAKEGEEIWL